MKNIILILAFCLSLISCETKPKTVHIKGELKDFASEFIMNKYSPLGMLLKEGEKITLDDQNRFEITFELEEAAYYRLGRNLLYLTPGDNLELTCDMNKPEVGSFIGDAVEECNYLKSKPFPKGGSYLTQGGNMLKDNPTKEMVRERIAVKVKTRQAELDALQNVSKKFRKMESARILFDAANSLTSYGFYAAYMSKVPQDKMKQFAEEATAFFKNDIDRYCANGNDVDYLNVDTYLSVVDRCIQLVGEENFDQKITDFGKAYSLIMNLGYSGPVASILTEKQKVVKELKTPSYIDAITKAFKKYDIIMPGKLAADLNMKNRAGESVKLSDYRDQIVVIDVWATWCGPCKAESPYYEKIAEKYKGDKIKFISISIDTNIKAWEKYLAKHEKTSEQLICNRTEFEKYVLQGVPRFMVIDKEGKIIDVFAPAPSNPEFEKLIVGTL
ncbi:MAG: TlpA family protein disulfide reductase [Labilibaculum sp.]|nr:TlpA disulfide reductase family protein [Labilibaculum sp.]MBI9057206.1 TlpA family protein disulfide reductase [Labilibaculum sp.]